MVVKEAEQPDIRSWQRYLMAQGYYHGNVDGDDGTLTKKATTAFQRANGLTASGDITRETLERAKNTYGKTFQTSMFQIGPDREEDLRELRPYFVLPLEEYGEPLSPNDVQYQNTLKRILSFVESDRFRAGPVFLRIPAETDGQAPTPPGLLRDTAILAKSLAGTPPAATGKLPVHAHLRTLLPEDTLRVVDAYATQPADAHDAKSHLAVAKALAGGFNALIAGPCLYQPGIFPYHDEEPKHAREKLIDELRRVLTVRPDATASGPEHFTYDESLILRRRLINVLYRDDRSRLAELKDNADRLLETPADEEGDGKRLLDELVKKALDALEGSASGSRDTDPAGPGPFGRDLLVVNRQLLRLALPQHFPPLEPKGEVTDVYVLSHGWHRNFFQGVAAYDQLVSRLSILTRRERVQAGKKYQPLFLCAHWHSDPGEDGWYDAAGRRSVISFFCNIEFLFERPEAIAERSTQPGQRFADVFENAYDFFARLSSADTCALSTEEIESEARRLATDLNRFSLRDAPAAELADKVAVAWACYSRSDAVGPLSGQEEKPRRVLSGPRAWSNLGRFVAGAVGISAVVGLLLHGPISRQVTAFGKLVLWPQRHYETVLASWIIHFKFIPPHGASLHNFVVSFAHGLSTLLTSLGYLAMLALLGTLYLWALSRRPPETLRKRGVPLWHLVAWLPVQLLMTLPLFLYLFGTYFGVSRLFGGRLAESKGALPGTFDERLGGRDSPMDDESGKELYCLDHRRWMHRRTSRRKNKDIRTRRAYRYAEWARLPVALFRYALHRQNPGHPVVTLADNQFAFWQMQVRGVRAGDTAGGFVGQLVYALSANRHATPSTRVHLVGHSFGALVILNAARRLVQKYGIGTADKPKLQSLTLLQGAVASNWFEEEEMLVRTISGAVGCVYSAYDTANGFYYPVANQGRYSAGFVGCYKAGNDGDGRGFTDLPGEGVADNLGMLNSLVRPPELNRALRQKQKACRDSADQAKKEKNLKRQLFLTKEADNIDKQLSSGPLLVNLDASHIIHAGSLVSGGGHDDIFKDDVVHLCWAVTQAGSDKNAPSPDRA